MIIVGCKSRREMWAWRQFLCTGRKCVKPLHCNLLHKCNFPNANGSCSLDYALNNKMQSSRSQSRWKRIVSKWGLTSPNRQSSLLITERVQVWRTGRDGVRETFKMTDWLCRTREGFPNCLSLHFHWVSSFLQAASEVASFDKGFSVQTLTSVLGLLLFYVSEQNLFLSHLNLFSFICISEL